MPAMGRENEVIDLRTSRKGCTNHPVVRFTNIIRRISGSDEDRTYTILFNEEDIPVAIVKKYVERYNMRILELKKIDGKQVSVIVEKAKQ